MSLLAIPFPNIDPVALRFQPFGYGPIEVKWYGLAYMAGLLLGWLYIKWLLRQPRLWSEGRAPFAPDRVDDLLLFMTVGVMLGGRLGYVLFYQPAYFFQHPLEIFAVWNGGMAFHGALVGSIIAIVLFARRIGTDAWSVLDLAAAATPMGLFFGRIANFINGELWGRPSSVPWAMPFPEAGPAPRHPSQLYEAMLEGLVLFAILWWLTHSKLALKRPGVVAGVFMAGYGLARSFSELFREPDADHWLNVGPLTAGILYSLPMIAAGVLILRMAVSRTHSPVDVQR